MATSAELSQFLSANPPSVSIGGGSLNDSAFTAWLGPTTNVAPLQPWENRRTGLWTMPSDYIMNPARNMENTFTLTMLTVNNFLINYILPMKVTDQITFSKQMMIFGPHLPNRVPHLGPVRFVNSYMQRSSQTLIRYGLGFQMEHEHMKTEMGAKVLIYSYKQIAQAFIEHMQLDAINALLNADDWERSRFVQLKGLQDATYTRQTEAIMEREKDLWAYVQQESANAWSHLDSFVEEKHGYISPNPLNTWIVDHRVTVYCRHVPSDQVKFAEFGPGNQQNVRSGIEYFRIDERGNSVYATRSFYNDGQLLNSLEHIRQNGGYWIVADPPGTDYKSKYTSHDLTIEIHDEDGNCLSPISLDKMIANCNRFTSAGTLKTSDDLYIQDSKNSKLEDDFLYHLIDGKVVPLAFFGQLQPKHFNSVNQQNLAESVIAQLVINTQRAGLNSALRDLDECMRVIHSSATRESLLDQLNEFTSASGFQERITGSLALKGNQFGSMDLSQSGSPQQLPATHGNYAGFKTIAENVKAGVPSGTYSSYYFTKISAALPIFEAFVDNLKIMFPNSAVFKVEWASPQLQTPTIYDVAFENLIGRQYPSFPIYRRVAGGGSSNNLAQLRTDARGILVLFQGALDAGTLSPQLITVFNKVVDFLGAAINDASIYKLAYAILRALWYTVGLDNTRFVDEVFEEVDRRIQARLYDIPVQNPDQTRFLDALRKFRSALRDYPDFINYANEVANLVENLDAATETYAMLPATVPAHIYSDLLRTPEVGYAVSRWDTYAPFKRGNPSNDGSIAGFIEGLSNYRGALASDPSNKLENMPLVKNAAISQTAGVIPGHPNAQKQAMLQKRFNEQRQQQQQRDVIADVVERDRSGVRRTFESGSGRSSSTSRKQQDAFHDPNAQISSFLDNTTVQKQLTGDFNWNFSSACSRFGSQPEFLCIILAFLWTPITEQALLASFDNNIMHPFNYVLVQPHRTYATVDGIKCIPGSETGNTVIAHVNVEIGNDPTVQTYNAALRMYHGACINNAKNIFVAPNIMVTEYLFGCGTDFCNPNKYDPVRAIYGTSKGASLMCFLYPRNTPLPLYFSLTGTMSWRDPMGAQISVHTGDKYAYATAMFENRIWGFNRINANNPDAVARIAGKRDKSFTPNMVVCRDAARYHDQTNNSWTRVTSTVAHWRIHLIGANKKRQRLGKDPVTPDNIQTGCTTFSFPIA